jgi:hypothetical protein
MFLTRLTSITVAEDVPQEPADDPIRIVGPVGVEGEIVDFASVGSSTLVDANGFVGKYLIANVRGWKEFFAVGAVRSRLNCTGGAVGFHGVDDS